MFRDLLIAVAGPLIVAAVLWSLGQTSTIRLWIDTNTRTSLFLAILLSSIFSIGISLSYASMQINELKTALSKSSPLEGAEGTVMNEETFKCPDGMFAAGVHPTKWDHGGYFGHMTLYCRRLNVKD